MKAEGRIIKSGRKLKRTNSAFGFTLIEIIIVLFIIGLATGIVGIVISMGSGSLETRTFTREISSALRYARNHAVSEKKIYCFVIDKDEQALRLYSEDTDYKNVVLVLDKDIPEELEVNLQDSDEESSYMEFFPHGNSTGGVIRVMDRKGSGFYITVNRVTGKLQVEKAE